MRTTATRSASAASPFPAVAGVYYPMALSLYPEAAHEAVFSVVAQGLAWAGGADLPVPVSKSCISSLRSRIGPGALRGLIRTCCLPLADPAVNGVPDAAPSYRLITNLLDPQAASAVELTKPYQQRPRMVKRRDSSYVPHHRGKPKTVCDLTPVITAPTGRRPPPPPRLKLPTFIIYWKSIGSGLAFCPALCHRYTSRRLPKRRTSTTMRSS